MAIEIINGLRPVGHLGKNYFTNETKDAVFSLWAGNTVVQRGTMPFLSFLDSKTLTVERVPGQSIPITEFNVYFTDGGYTSNGYGFDEYVSKFDLPREKGFNAVTFDWTQAEILQARGNGIDLMEKVTKQIEGYVRVYQNRVLPYRMLQALITGSSLALEIPSEDTSGAFAYTRCFGWLRGEDVTSRLLPTALGENGKRCHYRGTKGKTFAYSDVTDCIDLLKSYIDASDEKPYALANTRTIRNTIGASLEYAGNKDEVLVIGNAELKYKEALECRWVDMNSMLPEGVIIFLDAGATDILVKAVSQDESQRGIAFIKDFGGEMHKLDNAEAFAGGNVHVFPEELMVLKRHQGVILDTTNQGQQGSGKDGWAQNAGSHTQKKLNDFVKNLRKSYIKEMK